MPLTRCLECGREISEAAPQCPACSTSWPRGVRCEICFETSVASGAVMCVRVHDYTDGPSRQEHFAHKACIDEYFSVPRDFACPDCHLGFADFGTDMAPITLWSRTWKNPLPVACSRCGRSNLLGLPQSGASGDDYYACHCDGCTAPLYTFQRPPRGRGHGHPSGRGSVKLGDKVKRFLFGGH